MREIAGLTDWLQDRYQENIRPGRLLMELDMMMGAEFAREAARRLPAQDVAFIPDGDDMAVVDLNYNLNVQGRYFPRLFGSGET
ncbi:ribosomal protein L16 [Rhizobium sp. NXC14]|uniref:ribosomal protein L16 n=1 Tax=Rhizobium sp. NXC14 TaxID=1981173 RepID=UPI001FDA7C37|nr:ribosomal protein L16 [Rhizobium sp. NXC14]